MRIWVYGADLEQIQAMIGASVGSGDTVAGASVCAGEASAFPQSGLTPAMSAAIQGKIDLLLVPRFELLGNKAKVAQTIELFQAYGVSIKSVFRCGISSS